MKVSEIVEKIYHESQWHWMEKAACQEEDPELFYGEKGKFSNPRTMEALRVCRMCPVKTDCLKWAIETGDGHGILGGMTPAQRSRYRREMRYISTTAAIK